MIAQNEWDVTDFVPSDRRNLSGTQPKVACGKYSSCRFSFSAARNTVTKATLRIFVFLSPLESLNVAFGKRCELFIVLAVIILEKVWKTSTDWEWWRLCYSFINLAKWRERRVQCKRLIGDIRRTWKNIVFFQKLLVVTYLFFFVTHHVTNVW